jgi:hypothetical protein
MIDINGSCHCGNVSYEAKIDPEKVIICHCTDCQIMSGGAYRWGTLVGASDFHLLRGEPTYYQKTSESGSPRYLAFCGTCGTSLWGGDSKKPSQYSLRLSTADQAKNLAPKLQIWHRSSYPWVKSLHEITAIEAQDF